MTQTRHQYVQNLNDIQKLHVRQTHNYVHNVISHSHIIISNARQIGIYTPRNSQCYFRDLTGSNILKAKLFLCTR